MCTYNAPTLFNVHCKPNFLHLLSPWKKKTPSHGYTCPPIQIYLEVPRGYRVHDCILIWLKTLNFSLKCPVGLETSSGFKSSILCHTCRIIVFLPCGYPQKLRKQTVAITIKLIINAKYCHLNRLLVQWAVVIIIL